MVFLQGTHFQSPSHPGMRDRFFPLAYYSSSNTKTKGVAILFSKLTPWICKEISTHPAGHFAFVKGQIGHQMFTFACVDLPNTQQLRFLEHILSRLEYFHEGILILGGDFNLCPNPRLDTSKGSSYFSSSACR